MNRAIRWLYYSKRQREVALGLAVGSCTGLGYANWQNRRPLLADSGTIPDANTWSSKPTVVSHHASLAERAKDNSSKQSVRLPQSTEGQQPPPSQTKVHGAFDSKDDLPNEITTAWQDATGRVAAVCDSFTGFDFAALRTRITNKILPSWVRMMPGYLDKLRNELSGEPWTLAWEIWEDAHDPEIHPEIIWDARVRMSKDLCSDEQAFISKRQSHTTKALARYLGVRESEIHPDDVPVIGICGSGGGLRALVAGASSALCTQEAGLFDCVTYTAGVSGSCWLQTLYNSSIGQQDFAKVIDHLKHRIGVHIAYPPAALSLLSQAPTNKYLLSGFVEKLRGVPDAEFGLVDVYGLLLAARLLVPKNELSVSDSDLKISNQRYDFENGQAPLPIYTAVRHEIPGHLKDHITPSKYAWHNTKHYDWFQWFEWTPFEFFCEELGCGIPTWAVGRKWKGGKCEWRENGLALPELRTPLMMGIWGSAFCATLSHYYKEIRPILKAGGLTRLDGILAGNDDDLVKVHPIDPSVIPNFAIGLRDKLPDNAPESIHETTHLQLMDAGMSNNLPIYPLLRPGRNVDVILAFDASADVKTDNWVKVVDGYARQRNIKGWPMGAGWPPQSNAKQQTVEQLDDAQVGTMKKINDALEDTPSLQQDDEDLSYCNIWVGTNQERQEYMDEPRSKRLKPDRDDSHLTAPDAGITLIYFPFLANEKVSGVDPMKDDFMSTWNFIYTPEEIDKVVALARANFGEGKEQTRRAIRAVWERKRTLRLLGEQEQKELQRRYGMRRAGESLTYMEQNDHFR